MYSRVWNFRIRRIGFLVGIVSDIHSLSVHDGPGRRTVVYLKGCPLRCWWCANPEYQGIFPQVGYSADKCKGCLSCVNACPVNAIEVVAEPEESTGFIKINREKCKCVDLDCFEACPNGGLTTWGSLMTVEEVMKIIRPDVLSFGEAGGVTLSGGEPLFQHEFGLNILRACKEEHINTTIETTLFAPFEVVESFIPYVDLFVIDIKQMEDSKHKEYTGVTNKTILENIASLTQMTKSVLIRIPLIPGCNDDVSNIRDTAKFVHECGLDMINILPYHNLGQNKCGKLGKEYKLEDTNTPETDAMELKRIVEEQGIKCIIA